MSKKYYWLRHRYKKPSWTSEEAKSIGIFDSVITAEGAAEQLRDQPGFVKYPDGFEITELTLDQIDWHILRETISPFDLPISPLDLPIDGEST